MPKAYYSMKQYTTERHIYAFPFVIYLDANDNYVIATEVTDDEPIAGYDDAVFVGEITARCIFGKGNTPPISVSHINKEKLKAAWESLYNLFDSPTPCFIVSAPGAKT
jgi:hypothetical protein